MALNKHIGAESAQCVSEPSSLYVSASTPCSQPQAEHPQRRLCLCHSWLFFSASSCALYGVSMNPTALGAIATAATYVVSVVLPMVCHYRLRTQAFPSYSVGWRGERKRNRHSGANHDGIGPADCRISTSIPPCSTLPRSTACEAHECIYGFLCMATTLSRLYLPRIPEIW